MGFSFGSAISCLRFHLKIHQFKHKTIGAQSCGSLQDNWQKQSISESIQMPISQDWWKNYGASTQRKTISKNWYGMISRIYYLVQKQGTEQYICYTTFFTKKKKRCPKTDRKLKQTFHQRRQTDHHQAHEKMLNIANYQRNANQTA